MSLSPQRSEFQQSPNKSGQNAPVSVRSLRQEDLVVADRVFRLAFGTFAALPDPMNFLEGRDFVRSRWRMNPQAAFAAESSSELIGSSFATRWGSVGVLGPLTVHPAYWDRGVGKRLLNETMGIFDSWGLRHVGLFTFAHSPKHVCLYQKFGFYPRCLTAVMEKSVRAISPRPGLDRYSALSESRRSEALRACNELTQRIFDGLSLESEVRAVQQHKLGDTLLLWNESQLRGLAVCHFGPGTEGGANCCYVKFAAAAAGSDGSDSLRGLLEACEAVAADERLLRLEAGVSLAREPAYRAMLASGFRIRILGVAMHRPNEPAYHRPDAFVIDDWR